MRDLRARLRPSPGEVGRDPGRNADDPAQSVVLPAADAGAARRSRRAPPDIVRGRVSRTLSRLDRVVLHTLDLVRRDQLVLCTKLEIAGVVAFMKLLRGIAC